MPHHCILMNYSTLYVPIEFKNREFLAKLLFSLHAAEAGFDVILGGNLVLTEHIGSLEPGLFMEKSVFTRNTYWIRQLRVLGHSVAAWCEEGLTLQRNDMYCIRRVSRDAFEEIEPFIAWGDNQADAIAGYLPDQAHKIHRLGNPRLDLLRLPYRRFFEPQARALQQQYGDYLLFNSNFQHANNILGTDYFLGTVEKYKGPYAEQFKAYFRAWDAHKKEAFQAYLRFLPRLSASFPEKTVIVRPHPAEESAAWEEAAKGLDNVRVVYEGSALPWILGSSAVLHHNCTTAVEGYVMGRPSVSYKPPGGEGLEMEIADAVSLNAPSEEATIEGLRRVLAQDPPPFDWIDEPSLATIHYYMPMDEGGPSCSDRICELLRSRAAELEANPALDRLPPVKWVNYAVRRKARQLRGVVGKWRGSGKYYERLLAHKFPGLSLEEVRETAAAFANASDRFHDVQAEELEGRPGCFLLRRRG